MKMPAKKLRDGDTFVYGGKTHVANKVSVSGGTIFVNVPFGEEGGEYHLTLSPDDEVDVTERSSDPEPTKAG